MATESALMDKIVALCKRRGFIFQSSDIYGGIGGFWDYGPLGTELKRNVKEAWWNDMVRNPPPGPNGIEYQMVGLDCSIVMNPKVWEASGHVGGFSDPMVDCKTCKARFRADKVFTGVLLPAALLANTNDVNALRGNYPTQWGDNSVNAQLIITLEGDALEDALNNVERAIHETAQHDNLETFKKCAVFGMIPTVDHVKKTATSRIKTKKGDCFFVFLKALTDTGSFSRRCPRCHTLESLTEPRMFNLMFESYAGAVKDEANKVYLRPETAQGIFANFKNVIDSSRVKLPFGIAQIGKSFRNEINPRNYTFRSREFEQYEIEFFCHPSEAATWYEYWRDLRYQWYIGLGLKSEKLRLREHEPDELAHYAESCADVEYDFPFGLSELEGIANRTDYDLKAHIDKSGKDLAYFDDQRKERFVPYVIEPSGGVDRSMLAFITEAYHYDESRASKEFLKFHPRLAPVKAAVFPLVAKDGMPEIAEPIFREIKKLRFPCQYEAKQSIGKRYARMDEAGTPFCFTIDGQTKEDGTVTVRDRDDASQIRIPKEGCLEYLHDKLGL